MPHYPGAETAAADNRAGAKTAARGAQKLSGASYTPSGSTHSQRPSELRNRSRALARLTGGAPFVTLEDAAFRLGESLIFEHTEWRMRQNEQWAIIGGNGSGKSLLGDALRGALPLVWGEMKYHFRAPRRMTAEECIGHVSFEERKANVREMVVQSRWNSLEEEGALTVGEFLGYERVMEVNPFEIVEKPAMAKRVFEQQKRRAMQLLGIEPFLGRTLLSLSNGETQRLQIARALCRPVRWLILDEPFIGLDAVSRRRLANVLELLMRGPLCVMLITTRPEDLPSAVTHIAFVENCRLTAAGSKSSVLGARMARRLMGKSQARLNGASDVGPKVNSCAPELLRLRNVTVRYGRAVILRNVSWSVREGESWALLGPNGSGKTTLLSLILGDNPQVYANDVTVFGRRRGTGESLFELRKQIGWVSPELHMHFDDTATCLEVVESGFRETIGLFEPATAAQKVAARNWLRRFGLLRDADTPLFALSAGLQRMVLLARALVKKPRLLILDEPCQGLDATHRNLFLTTLDKLLRSRAETAIYVTHRREEIPPSIHRILNLEKPN